jgi:type I restriction enzyme S subunit
MSDLGEMRSGGTPATNRPEYWGGGIPWCTPSDITNLRSRFIAQTRRYITREGLRDSSADLLPPGSVVVCTRATIGEVAINTVPLATNQGFKSIVPNSATDVNFLYYLILSLGKELRRRAAGSTFLEISGSNFARVPVKYPEARSVQSAIARPLVAIDNAREDLARLIAAKRDFKRGLTYDLLTGRRRFPEFRGHTLLTVRFGDHASELIQRNGQHLGADRVMGVIKGVGLEPMRERVRALDLRRYKVVPPDAFAYNPMRLNIGSIARSCLTEDCLVSPDYVVFKADKRVLLPAFVDQVRHSHIWHQFMRPAGSGSVRVRIYYRDLAEMRIPLPSLAEQHRIAATLECIDKAISLLERLRDAYDIQKRGLMQRLLSGNVFVQLAIGSGLVSAHA